MYGGKLQVPELMRGHVHTIEGELSDELKPYVSKQSTVSLEDLKERSRNHRIHLE
jgi:hypothetical protein